MRMARVNVYLPDDLAEASRAAGLNVSRIAQDALRAALEATATSTWLDGVRTLPPTGITHDDALDAVRAARDELGDG
jgi:post-segregation antitoxin (ccd killing protein)